MKRVRMIHSAIFIGALVSGSAAFAQTLPSASPGAPCKTPGMAATYGDNGMLLCSASLTWKAALPASTTSNDGGPVSTVSQRMGRAMATVVDGAAQFIREMLSPASD
ncbi:hypothetical protein [Cupriavidus sp. UYPR2.512]|uniref:hypothetical protein n=1 Tax=Cupriavidus sp. UYPR2.512 TaxID=1080187 RepID=UPI0012FC38D1|nr:hypothetical protein [Cupriavidus sp. UYPR2.512]UIF89444.1 hypothetical protein KAF44_29695 [Cupriavidus necator]